MDLNVNSAVRSRISSTRKKDLATRATGTRLPSRGRCNRMTWSGELFEINHGTTSRRRFEHEVLYPMRALNPLKIRLTGRRAVMDVDRDVTERTQFQLKAKVVGG